MFGRSRSGATRVPTTPTTPLPEKQSGKGRPTPRRREAEQRNRHPVVGASKLSPNATKEERKAARAARREALAAERGKAREAMVASSAKVRGLRNARLTAPAAAMPAFTDEERASLSD